ncbi:MAG: hypothetical protein R2839_10385 [Thermomicrobiales bacterium]
MQLIGISIATENRRLVETLKGSLNLIDIVEEIEHEGVGFAGHRPIQA